MAFRPVSMASSVVFISADDPAVDWRRIIDEEVAAQPSLQAPDIEFKDRDARARASFMGRFIEATMDDPGKSRQLLRFIAGQEPTEWVLGVIPPDEMVRIADETSREGHEAPRERRWRAFLAALRDVRPWPEPVKKRKVGDVEYVDQVWAKVQFGLRGLRNIALDVGLVAWAWNNLREDEAKN